MWILAGILGAILVLVILKLASPQPSGSGLVSKLDGQAVAASIVQELGTVPLSAYDGAGASGASLPFGGSATTWRDTGGKPVFFYAGGEFCPYCAASRWAMVTALARFGHWSGLEYWNSSKTDYFPGTPTFTFLHATMTSQYVDFQGVELYSSTPASTGGYATLQTPTAVQSSALTKYGSPPYVPSSQANGIPFIDIGNRYIWSATLYNPGVLTGLSWAQIAKAVHGGTGAAAQAILANANVLSAAICAVDGQQPAAVCGAAAVRAAAAQLPGPMKGNKPVGGGSAKASKAAPAAKTTGHSVIGGKTQAAGTSGAKG